MTESDIYATLSTIRVADVDEWRRIGVTPPRLRTLVRSGALVRVRRGVYATRPAVDLGQASPATGHALRVSAALAAVGRDGVASHHSAALLHGLDLFPAAPDVVALTRAPARHSSRRPADGIAFHAAALPAGHVTRRFGLPVTTVARTVVDIARTSTFMSAVVTADSALRSDSVGKEALGRVCDACGGWPGIENARRAVSFSDPRSDSALESRARVVFEENGIDPPELQKTITTEASRFTVDFYWPRYHVIAETDGAMKYADPRRAIRQLERDQALRDAGYKVVHFTWREFFDDAQPVLTRLRAAFKAPAAY